jgi:hypothetical protein
MICSKSDDRASKRASLAKNTGHFWRLRSRRLFSLLRRKVQDHGVVRFVGRWISPRVLVKISLVDSDPSVLW